MRNIRTKDSAQVETNFGHATSVCDVTAETSIFITATDWCNEVSPVVWCWSPAELFPESECRVGGYGPSVLGYSTDDRYTLFGRAGTELVTFGYQYRLIHLHAPSVYCVATCLAELA